MKAYWAVRRVLKKTLVLKRIEELTEQAKQTQSPIIAFVDAKNKTVDETYYNGIKGQAKHVIRQIKDLKNCTSAQVTFTNEEELED